ncbi:hypothetical protein QRQ56_31095 [Bradyrhizobium sp. U531]|uniref:hypothetical protein n=1 Tax=Bradyrhizobium sp. U531 TaxID=3053458 RepID=UPI003F41C6BE
MTKTYLEALIEIQADLAELRRLAEELSPELARVIVFCADQMEARARALDQMA